MNETNSDRPSRGQCQDRKEEASAFNAVKERLKELLMVMISHCLADGSTLKQQQP